MNIQNTSGDIDCSVDDGPSIYIYILSSYGITKGLVGPFMEQELHNVNMIVLGSFMQGRHTILSIIIYQVSSMGRNSYMYIDIDRYR
jgi:hypothetical protein